MRELDILGSAIVESKEIDYRNPTKQSGGRWGCYQYSPVNA